MIRLKAEACPGFVTGSENPTINSDFLSMDDFPGPRKRS
jgi:hypothetical protein